MQLDDAVKAAGISRDEFILIEAGIADAQRTAFTKRLKMSGQLSIFLSRLVKRNPNVGIRMGLDGETAKFPHSVDLEKAEDEKGLMAEISLRKDAAGIYWPGSTRLVSVALVQATSRVVEINFKPFQKPPSMDLFELIIQKCSFNSLPVVLPGVSFEEVEAIFKQVSSDITEVAR